MKIDLTVQINTKKNDYSKEHEIISASGHIGTHFDVMDKIFPLEFTERDAVVFDVSKVIGRNIEISDIDTDYVKEGQFTAFYNGIIDEAGFGTERYYKEQPQLSDELIDFLLDKKVSIIAVDFAGIKRGKEHPEKDQYCADRGAFVVENLCNLKDILMDRKTVKFKAHTYPVNFVGLPGLPCRVVAEI